MKFLKKLFASKEVKATEGELYQQVPFQFKKLSNLMSQYSEKYCTETEIVFRKFRKKWNSSLTRFEIDMFFLSSLSFSICELKQNMDVIRGVQTYFNSLLQNFSAQKVSGKIIENRVKNYCKLKHDCINDKNRTIETEMLNGLLYHIEGVLVVGNIAETYPVVIQDFFGEAEFKSVMFPVHMRISGEFCCCLKHLFKSTSDIRFLSSDKIDSLIGNGKKEAKDILSNLDFKR